jgi:hypothetical protein
MDAVVPPSAGPFFAAETADARYAEPLAVDDLAHAAGLSRVHLAEFRRSLRRIAPRSPSPGASSAAASSGPTDRSVASICFSGGLRSVGSFTMSFTWGYG